MNKRVTHLHVNRSLNCVLEIVQCISIIISDQPLLFWLLLCSHINIFFFFQLKRENRYLAILLNEILRVNSNSFSPYPIKWLFSQLYNCNLIIKSTIIYFTICEIWWEKNGINKEMTPLHFSLKLLEILLYYLKFPQSHSRGGLLMAADRQWI